MAASNVRDTISRPFDGKISLLVLLKSKIKRWESDFFKERGRKPTKEDISTAPDDIEENYKEYWNLMKTSHCDSPLRNEVWSAKLNKHSQNKQDAKDKCRTNHECNGNVLKGYINKLRNQALLTKKCYAKLPSRNHLGNANTNHSEQLANVPTDLQPINKPTIEKNDCGPLEKVNEPVETDEFYNSEWKMPVTNLQFSKNTFKNGRIRLSNTFLSARSVTGICSAKVDADWLERCSKDFTGESNNGHLENIIPKKDAHLENYTGKNLSVENMDEFRAVSDGKENISNAKNEGTKQSDDNCTLNSKDSEIESRIQEEKDSNVQFGSNEKSSEQCFECSDDARTENTIRSRKRKVDDPNSKPKRPRASADSSDCKFEKTVATKNVTKKGQENFVKLNLKKKVFVRGKRNFSYKKFKRDKWKHYQKNKQKSNLEADDALELDAHLQSKTGEKENCDGNNVSTTLNENVDNDLPTLTEAASFPSETNESTCNPNCAELITSKPVDRIYNIDASGKVIATPKHVMDSLRKIGFEYFRPGQEEAVMRILSGLSALVVLPTGTGKSLCYQLPALLYSESRRCITLVISPLVSLMEDQVANAPSCLNAACWHSNMTEVQKTDLLEKLSSGNIDILLVSPETLVSGNTYLFDKLPPVSFVCIDEAHCLSEWSHNFRPSYLQLVKVLTTKMGVSRILALTATASKATTKSIATHLGLIDDEAVIEITGIPDNLYLSVSRDEFRDEALVHLLRGERFSKCQSIIIYCTRREETERVSSTIRICMQEEDAVMSSAKSKIKKGHGKWFVEAYHSGLTPAKRKSVQKKFMNGSLRIVVATVAFGMGLNKIDVRGIIHYNMPKTFEHYVQEIGRAGRDGKPSHCHLFLNAEGKDLPELRRHIYSNSVDRHLVRKLLLEVFKPCRCMELYSEGSNPVICPGHEIAIPICDIVNELDLKEENIATLLCYLEFLPEKWIEFLQPVYSKCTIRCYKGQSQLRELVTKCPPVAVAVGLAKKTGKSPLDQKETRFDFDMVRVASHMDWASGVVKKQLKNLEWTHVAGRWKKTGVMVEFSNLAFHLRANGTLSDDQKDRILDYLYEKVTSTERRELKRLWEVNATFKKASHAKYLSCCDVVDLERSQMLKKDLMQYYAHPTLEYQDDGDDAQNSGNDTTQAEIICARKDIRAMLEIHHDTNFAGRAVARIFHGIGSPCFPIEVWGRVRRFWRSHVHIDFNLLISIANEEIRKMR